VIRMSSKGLGRVKTATEFFRSCFGSGIRLDQAFSRDFGAVRPATASIEVSDAPARSNCAYEGSHAAIAAINGRMPMMFMTRVRL